MIASIFRAALALAALSAAAPAQGYVPPEWSGPAPADAAGGMLVIHGGGWGGGDYTKVVEARGYADRYNATLTTMNIDYRSGRAGFEDVLAQYDELRARMGGKPVCATGYSAGGHFALMLAARRDVACVVAEGAPTNLFTVGPYVQPLVGAAFGYDEATRTEWSPALHTAEIRARVLMVNAENDDLVTLDQSSEITDRLPGARSITVPAGDKGLYHVHSSVDAGALRAAIDEERRFVAEAMAPPAPVAAPVAATPTVAPVAKNTDAKPRKKRQKRKHCRR